MRVASVEIPYLTALDDVLNRPDESSQEQLSLALSELSRIYRCRALFLYYLIFLFK